MIEGERSSIDHRLTDGRIDEIPILGMHAGQERLVPWHVILAHAIDSVQLLGPPQRVGGNIPFPAAHVGDLLGFEQAFVGPA